MVVDDVAIHGVGVLRVDGSLSGINDAQSLGGRDPVAWTLKSSLQNTWRLPELQNDYVNHCAWANGSLIFFVGYTILEANLMIFVLLNAVLKRFRLTSARAERSRFMRRETFLENPNGRQEQKKKKERSKIDFAKIT